MKCTDKGYPCGDRYEQKFGVANLLDNVTELYDNLLRGRISPFRGKTSPSYLAIHRKEEVVLMTDSCKRSAVAPLSSME